MKILATLFVMGVALVPCVKTLLAQEDFIYDAKGKRDPFTPALEETTVPKAKEFAGKLNELRQLEVTGILLSQSSSLAVIGDEILQVGQEIKGAKVVEIRQREVILEYQGEKVTLQVKEPEYKEEEPKKKSKKQKGKGAHP